MNIVLYVTDACSLCDHALDLLFSAQQLSGHTLTTIDITIDDSLLDRLSEKIPVLAVGDRELVWPFSVDDVVSLLSNE